MPFSAPTEALFIAYLYDRQYASSTVNTYVSAIGYSHKLYGLPDPTKPFFILQILKGYGKRSSRLDCRLPITVPLLHKILSAAAQLTDSHYNICQFRAMCLFAFFTFSRIGKITASNSGNTINLQQVTKLLTHNNEVASIKVQFLNYKHSYNQRPFSLVVSRQATFCPVEHLLTYLNVRGYSGGPLFRMADGSPVTRSFFTKRLTVVLKF